MRWLCAAILSLWPLCLAAQSTEVFPGQLKLSVHVEDTGHVPLAGEMVMITIRGVYRRHITREKLLQPDLAGFSWSQLGQDNWFDERIDGESVKVMERRMALYPDRAGELSIGAFTHQLTLTDEGDDWFDYQIQSDPVSITVDPAPAVDGWWFPTRRLRVSDQWSNAPDQLAPGEGVLRVVRIEALGVTPEMIPPMPELTSPSGMIFPHPEKRLVELTPEGPLTYAFWRWTIRPTNATSAIVEPLEFSYFDTFTRDHRTVTISPQRVAYGQAVPPTPGPGGDDPVPPPAARLPGWPEAVLAAIIFAGGLGLALSGWQLTGWRALQRFGPFDPMVQGLHRAARAGRPHDVRRWASGMARRDGLTEHRRDLLAALDQAIYSRAAADPDLAAFAREFAKRRPDPPRAG